MKNLPQRTCIGCRTKKNKNDLTRLVNNQYGTLTIDEKGTANGRGTYICKDKLCGLLGLATRAGKVSFGTEACIMAIKKKKINLVIVAKDASDRTKKNFIEICNEKNIPIVEELEISVLSRCIGKSNKAVVAISDVNFSNGMLKIINGGEFIG